MTTDKKELPESLPDDSIIENFRLSLIQKTFFSNWLKKLLIYGAAAGIAGGALSGAIIGSLVLANVLTVSFFTVTPVLPILIIAAAAIIAFFAIVDYKAITSVKNPIKPKDFLKVYEKLETNKDGKTYIESYFEKENPNKKLKNQKDRTIKNTISKWRNGGWKENKENKENWEELYLKHNNQKHAK